MPMPETRFGERLYCFGRLHLERLLMSATEGQLLSKV
jgi:hypothetical protein